MKKNIKKMLFFAYSAALFALANNMPALSYDVNITNPASTSDFNKLVGNALQWVLSVAGSVALVMFIAGGIMYITAGGEEQKITTAKKIVTFTIYGLALILVSYAIISVLNQILTQ